jgi:hypothetical protein
MSRSVRGRKKQADGAIFGAGPPRDRSGKTRALTFYSECLDTMPGLNTKGREEVSDKIQSGFLTESATGIVKPSRVPFTIRPCRFPGAHTLLSAAQTFPTPKLRICLRD